MAHYIISPLVPPKPHPLYDIYGPGDEIAGVADSEDLARVWVELLAEREAEVQAALDANDLETARRIWGEVEDAAITITQGA